MKRKNKRLIRLIEMYTTFKSPKHRPRLWVGKKTRAWINARNRLKKKFKALGITRCELGYEDCWQDTSLGFAHGKRRRHLVGNEIEDLTILACNSCHEKLDRLPAASTLVIVQSVIAEREIAEALSEMS